MKKHPLRNAQVQTPKKSPASNSSAPEPKKSVNATVEKAPAPRDEQAP